MRDYNRDLFKHNQELILEVERLNEEVKSLKAYKRLSQDLQAKIDKIEGTIEERIAKGIEKAITKAVAEAIAPYVAENTELREKVASQQEEISRLKAQINKDSSNSSKPPSTNGFKKVPNNRTPSGKRQGGQKGHKGSRLNVPENLDELVSEGKAEHIVISEVEDGEAYTSDWEIDIKITPVFTEYRRAVGAPPKINYGNGVVVLCVSLSMIGLIAYERLSDVLNEMTYGIIGPSKKTLEKFNGRVAQNVDLNPMIQDILNGKVTNVDDTQIKTTERPCSDGEKLETSQKTTFNAYIRTYSNDTTTVLTANPRKNEEGVIADNILTRFHGIVAQDHEAKFYNYGAAHATCGAHLSRDLKGLETLCSLEWAGEVKDFIIGMNNKKNNDLANGITFCEPELLQEYDDRYDALVERGRKLLDSMVEDTFGYDELRKMVNRLSSYKDCHMLFIRDYDAPFTNNLAERDLRHCKTKQKVSGCFRSWQGVVDYCKIRSLLGTAKKRGQNLMDTIRSTLKPQVPGRQ